MIKDTDQQPDEEIHRARSCTKELLSLWAPHGDMWKCSVSPTWELFEPHPFGFFGGLIYIGIIDCI